MWASHQSRSRHAKVSADLGCHEVLDFRVAGNCGTTVLLGIVPLGMAATFPQKFTVMVSEMSQQLLPLPTAMCSSVK